ncbi:hypothetical protein SLEP1_g54007 [Rubroshorea leprosula]|uniref:Protein TIC 40, chloroplastic n=1 Tax=Rubroshorea leprosula TaxID=152421 RepID=A0AAV5MC72_9ROSI|nr:hypothetical protein SLEP1_g54007 [Rubroshorea leprosula]
MENLSMALVSSPPKLVLGYTHNSCLKNPNRELTRPGISSFVLPFSFRNSKIAPCVSRISLSAHFNGAPRRIRHNVIPTGKSGAERFASVSSWTGNQQTSSVGVNSNLAVPPPSSQIGSPLLWIAVGVGISALFSWGVSTAKKYLMQKAFTSFMDQMNTQNNQFSNVPFPSGSPFPYPTPSTGPPISPSPAAPTPSITVDVPVTKVETAPATDPVNEMKKETEIKEPKKPAFVDVSPEETIQKSPFENFEDVAETSSPKNVSNSGAAAKQDLGASGGFQSTGKPGSVLSVEALEKMMEDPTVQKMVFPYLPEEMRNPDTFKWMLQNPMYRQQLQDMLKNMGGSAEWDNRMMESLKNFDLSSPEVKQQFDQIGLTPEEVISKIMANPDVAMAFQNPRVQQAIMDCSQNPMSIAKYQNDKEVMDVFAKISELFPGVTGSS